MDTTTALVLLGHGSHISPNSAGLVWQQVDALRALGVADEVTAAFWKEQPAFSTVLSTLTAQTIILVPLFTAQGYFTRAVIPAEMGLDGAVTERDGRRIVYTAPIGEHGNIQHIVRQRVEAVLKTIGTPTQRVGVTIIGHGTQKNPQSRTATERQVQRLRETGLVDAVVAVYLDDTPAIPAVYQLLDTPIIIAVPNFLALGSHASLDVPDALGLPRGQTHANINGRQVFYTEPIGTGEALTGMILDMAREAGLPKRTELPRSAWECFPSYGKAALRDAVLANGEMHFGQLRLTPRGIYASGQAEQVFSTPQALRDHVRTSGGFRPLASTTDLPGNWRVECLPEQLAAVVETVYPGAVAVWAQQQNGQIAPTPLAQVIARQQGMYRTLTHFPLTEHVVQAICAACVYQPLWHQPNPQPNPRISCTEPCNSWLSAALEQTP